MIKCIIVEDEMLAQQVIQSHLQKVERFQLVGICNNAKEAQELLRKQEVDVMFLDIQMPGMTGLGLLKTLQDPPLVILTTAYADYALESYDFNVVDYLLKPISFERFSKALNKIADGKFLEEKPATGSNNNEHIFIKSSSRFFKVDFTNIIYVEGMKDYVKIHTHENMLVTHQTMQEMEQLLPPCKFMRIHKSYIIALSHVKSIFGNSIDIGKATLPIGVNYKEKVMSFVGI